MAESGTTAVTQTVYGGGPPPVDGVRTEPRSPPGPMIGQRVTLLG
jgi:hypothetical protein